MEHSIIPYIVLSMREYQKKKSIKKECLTNTQYLYDIIKMNFTNNVKTKAIYVFSDDDGIAHLLNHLVVVLDGKTIDPSFDVFCLKNKSYFDNIKDLMDNFDDKTMLKTRIDIKKYTCSHFKFIKLAEQINNGEFVICDRKHYDEQGDYVLKMHM